MSWQEQKAMKATTKAENEEQSEGVGDES